VSQIELYRGPESGLPMLPASAGGARVGSDRIDLRWLWVTLRRRARLFFSVMTLVVALAIVYAALQKPSYTAQAQVALNTAPQKGAPTTDTSDTQSTPDDAVADTEAAVLASRAMAERVANSLRIDEGKASRLGRLGRIELALGMRSEVVPTPEQRRRNTIDWLQSKVSIARVGTSLAFLISFSSPDPKQAAAIANEWARQYTFFNMSGRANTNDASRAFLGKQLDDLRNQANAYNAQVQRYRITHNMLSTSGASLTEQEISAYNEQVASARAQADEDQARLDTARAQLAHGSAGDDVGAALDSGVVSALRSRQAEAAANLASLSAHYGPKYPDVVKAQSELADVNASIKAEISRVVSNLDAKSQASRQRLASMEGSLSGARGTLAGNNSSQVELDDLLSQAAAKQALYQAYLSRYNETAAAEGGDHPDAQILTLATPPGAPSSPNYPLILLMGLTFGCIAGFTAAFVAETVFGGLTTADDIEARLGVPFLAGIPALNSIKRRASSPANEVIENPSAAFAEAFRGLRSALRFAHHNVVRTVAITSALPQEGKTTIAVCLARVSAMTGERVVIVDCDTRRRGTSRALTGSPMEVGLTEVLNGSVNLDDALIYDERSGAAALVLASTDGAAPELLVPAIDALLERLRERFDFIILDLPPVLPVADARIIAGKADATVFVARWRKTSDHAIRAALRMMPESKVTLAGVVLSRIDMRKQAKFGTGDATAYYHAYKSYYS
jgi:succinoglycan biosynthesis transport protein ExoP